MALPPNFSSWEHLQQVIMQVQNKIVRDEFNDLGDETWDEEITTPRGSLRTACTLRDGDSAIETQLKLDLFYKCLGKGKVFHPAIYGIPISSYQVLRKHKPQIHLWFKETTIPKSNADPLQSYITFRIMDESFTLAELTPIANRIKAEFTTGGGYLWRKGRKMCTYTDKEKGYQLQLLCIDESEGKRVVTSVLSIQNDVPRWTKFNIVKNDDELARFPDQPPNKIILGKSVEQPRERPVHSSRFRFAEFTQHGLKTPITLCDRTGTRLYPLVTA